MFDWVYPIQPSTPKLISRAVLDLAGVHGTIEYRCRADASCIGKLIAKPKTESPFLGSVELGDVSSTYTSFSISVSWIWRRQMQKKGAEEPPTLQPLAASAGRTYTFYMSLSTGFIALTLDTEELSYKELRLQILTLQHPKWIMQRLGFGSKQKGAGKGKSEM